MREFRRFEKFGGSFLALRAQLLGDLLSAAFLFEKLAFDFRRAPFGFRRPVRVGDDRVDDRRGFDESLLVEGDEFEQLTAGRFADEFNDRLLGRFRVFENSRVELDPPMFVIDEKKQHPRRDIV